MKQKQLTENKEMCYPKKINYNISHSIEEYEKAMELHKQGLGNERISKILNINHKTIGFWLYENGRPMEWRSKFAKPKKILKNKILDRNFAYILGVIKGDGSVYKTRGSYTIRLSVRDKDFALNFKSTLENWSGMKCHFYEIIKKAENSFRKIPTLFYEVVLLSKDVYSFIKSFDLNQLYSSSEEIKCAFLKGFFDGEGCVKINKTIKIMGLCNTNESLIKMTKKLLEDIGFKNIKIREDLWNKKINPNYKIVHILQFSYKYNFDLFLNKIGFSIERRQKKLLEAIKQYENNRYKYSINDYNLVFSLRKEGLTYDEISKHMNIPMMTIVHWLWKDRTPDFLKVI